MEQEQLFIDYIEQSIIQNWDRNALTDYQGITLQYKDVARKIAKFHIVLESAGIQPGDKIAVCGRNSAHWAVCFLATVTYISATAKNSRPKSWRLSIIRPALPAIPKA